MPSVSISLRVTGTTVNPNHTRLSGYCQAAQHTSEQRSPARNNSIAYRRPRLWPIDQRGGLSAGEWLVSVQEPGCGRRRQVATKRKFKLDFSLTSFSLFGKPKAVVGLDIGSSAVKAVEMKQAGKGYKVAAFGSEPVPPDSIVDGAIIDAGAVAESIRRVFEQKAFRTKEVAASLSGNAVIVKKISLPLMTPTELDESIYWEAEQYIPFDIQDVNLDYQILDAGASADSKGTMEVLLVAAKKEKIADYTGVISQAGRVPVVVDVDAFALQNAFEVNYGFEPDAVVVLLNAGASAININILSGGQSVFTRDVSIGGNAYTEAVQRELNLPFDAAEQLKRGTAVDGATFEDVRPVLRAMTDNVLLEVQKTFDFFKATAASDRIDRIMLSGGASRVDGFAEMLQDRFGTEVEDFDPFKRIAVDPRKFAEGQQESMGPTAAVAVGLALRRAGDR
ncbi:MAG: type IV pilus assembly protein PilM [Acidobacteria bacterium]|nr:MAG: type IV pilus assembly protein PilM [Acidobacteriota bacterium]